MSEKDKKKVLMTAERYEGFAKRMKEGKTLKDEEYWELADYHQTEQGKKRYAQSPEGLKGKEERKEQDRRIERERISDRKKEVKRKEAEKAERKLNPVAEPPVEKKLPEKVKIQDTPIESKIKTKQKLIPDGMNASRYRELIKVMNDPEYIGSEEVKSIKNHWNSYTKKKTWGNQEEAVEKPTSTQDIVREDIKKSVKDEEPTKKPADKKPTPNQNTADEKIKETVKKVKSEEKIAKETVVQKEKKKTSTQDVSRQTVVEKKQDVVNKKGKTTKKKNDGVIKKQRTLELPDVNGSATKMQAKIIKNAPKIMKGAALFIGTTSLLSTAMNMSEKSEQRAQVRQMEKGVKEKVKKEEKKRKDYKVQDSYGNIDTSGIVMEMFEQRVGHHKMGNSRF